VLCIRSWKVMNFYPDIWVGMLLSAANTLMYWFKSHCPGGQECLESVKVAAHLPRESGDGSRKDKASGWFVLVVVSAASSLQCLVGWQEGHPVCTHYPKGPLLEQKETQRGISKYRFTCSWYSGFRMLAVLTCDGVLGCVHIASVVAIIQVKTW